ncbi:MAG: choice-of-anchor B family protein [Nitriliruptorales bacterium]
MGKGTWRTRVRFVVASLTTGLLLAGLLGTSGAAAHPHPLDHEEATGLGVRVNAPSELADFFPAVQWGGTAEVDDQTAKLVYAGTGCTPASYAPVATEIRGNIALVDARASQTNPADQCPAFTFLQKARSAQHAGAIGFVQIPGEGEEPRTNATAVSADVPALEVHRNDLTLAVRDAVIAGTAVEATLTFIGAVPEVRLSDVPCENGHADVFECDGVDLLSFVPAAEIDSAGISDIWGWTDPETGDEYVMMGKTNGTAFFRVTDPLDPVYLGALPNPAVLEEVWHDIKVYKDHAFIVSESEPHGMTVFDLTRLRDVNEAQEWDADAFYRLNVAAHNVAINEDTGFAYIVGGNEGIVAPDQCLSGLHMVDISTPTEPTFAGCYLEEGGPGTAARVVGGPVAENSPAAYVHDAQCVIYDGPDERYAGREICFNFAETKVVIADVTDKLNPVTVGVTDYPNVGYTHQGWLTEDHAYLIANDELDETTHEINTRTLVFDVRDLENPKLHFEHFHDTISPDHNAYVHEGIVYQSNYSSGLRVLDASRVAEGTLEPIGFFDTFPAHSDPTFDGTWSNYPFFESGTIAVSGRAEGLFLLRLAEEEPTGVAVELACANCPVEIRAGESETARLVVSNVGDVDDTYTVSIADLPEGWSATADPVEVAVASGEDAEVAVEIDVPRREKKGTSSFTVTVTSSVDPDVSASAEVEVAVRKGRPSDRGRPSDAGSSGADSGLLVADASSDGGAAGGAPPVSTAAILALGVSVLVVTAVRRRLTR